jgi:hypothetical protein
MRIILAALAFAGAAQAQTVVYDTFNEADQANLFDCCNALTIAGVHRKDAPRSSVAIPFTPEAFAKITEVDVALSGGTLKVEIAGSTMGLPGRVKKSWAVDAPAAGQCCTYIAKLPGNPVHAGAGGQYWIVLKAVHYDLGGWNLNTIGASGPYAVRGDDGVWTMTEGPLPAVRVIAK